jgi:hypothetical protein
MEEKQLRQVSNGNGVEQQPSQPKQPQDPQKRKLIQQHQQQMGQQQSTGQQSPGPGPSNSSAGMQQMFGSPPKYANVDSLLDGYIPNPCANLANVKGKSREENWHALKFP